MSDLFSPRIFFPLSALSFILAGIAGSAFFPQFRVPLAAVLLQFLGIALFVAGTLCASKLERFFGSGALVISLFSVLVVYFSYLNFGGYWYLSLIVPLAVLYIRRCMARLSCLLMLAGALLTAANIYLGGIPLLNPSLRDVGYTPAWLMSVVLFLLGFGFRIQEAGRREVLLLSLGGALLLSLGGYRTPVIILAVCALTCASQRKLVSFRKIMPVFAILLLFIAAMGWFVAKPSLGPVQLLLFRAAYTNWIEGSILTQSPLLGLKGGDMWREYHPRFGIGETFAGRHRSISGGFFGSLWFDSGILGLMAGSFIAGAVIQHIYRRRRIVPAVYWIAIAYLAVSVETGLDFVYVAVFLASLFFVSGKKR